MHRKVQYVKPNGHTIGRVLRRSNRQVCQTQIQLKGCTIGRVLKRSNYQVRQIPQSNLNQNQTHVRFRINSAL